MIILDELTPIGNFAKTHGIKGEINIQLTEDFDFDNCEYIVVDIDGIFVPFFIAEYRYKSNRSLLMKIDDIDEESSARTLFGKRVYVKKELVVSNETELGNSYYVGFTIIDKSGILIGQITDVDNSTVNELFEVGEMLIPIASMELIELDEERKVMIVSLPEGLLDL